MWERYRLSKFKCKLIKMSMIVIYCHNQASVLQAHLLNWCFPEQFNSSLKFGLFSFPGIKTSSPTPKTHRCASVGLVELGIILFHKQFYVPVNRVSAFFCCCRKWGYCWAWWLSLFHWSPWTQLTPKLSSAKNSYMPFLFMSENHLAHVSTTPHLTQSWHSQSNIVLPCCVHCKYLSNHQPFIQKGSSNTLSYLTYLPLLKISVFEAY